LEIKTSGVHGETAAWAAKGASRRLRVAGTNLPWCHQLHDIDYNRP